MRNDQYPLHMAAKNGQIAKIDELLKEHDVNARDADGNTPLHYAIHGMQDQAAMYLLGKKANASLVNENGDTALHLYAAGGDQRGAAILNSEKKSAFAAQAIYIANARGETPLHVAITKDNMYFFTHFVKPLDQRYYEKINLKNNVFSTGPEGDSLVYVALKRLLNPALENNEDRTYTMLYLLAGEIPEMFSAKRSKTFISSQTPLEFSVEQKLPEKIKVLVENAHKIYLDTYAQKQMIGQLQQTLNRQIDVIQELQREVSQLKSQLALLSDDPLTQAVKEARVPMPPLSQLFAFHEPTEKDGKETEMHVINSNN